MVTLVSLHTEVSSSIPSAGNLHKRQLLRSVYLLVFQWDANKDPVFTSNKTSPLRCKRSKVRLRDLASLSRINGIFFNERISSVFVPNRS